MPGVRDAAVALIGVAPESTVLTVLRMLVDSLAPAPAQALRPPVPRRPSVNALTGLPFHSPERSSMTSCR